MSAFDVLDPTLKAILDVISPLREDWVVRAKIIEELSDVVRSVESLRGATVEPFGSFVSKLFTRWGDLDISIMLSNGAYISSTGKKYKQNLLEDVLKALRHKGGWHRLLFIGHARVPIIKFETANPRISGDISIDNLEGQMKSTILFWISEIDGRFRDMVLLVKEWAKAHNINNPKSGTLNSYSLTLLVIFHFQTCVPAILPPLKEIYPTNVVDDLTGKRTDAERQIKELCCTNINRYRANKHRAVNNSSLSELFLSFLAKFSDISLKAKELGVCPFSGQWEPISNNTRWLPRTFALFIEDPFEQPVNSARTVSAGNLEKISQAFQATHQSLLYSYQNQAYLLNMLVRAQVSKFIAGVSTRNSGYNSGHGLTNQQARTKRSEPQRQHQIQNTNVGYHPANRAARRGGYKSTIQGNGNHLNGWTLQRREVHPNNSTNQRQESHPSNGNNRRPVRQHRSQNQQMWRPKSDGSI